MANVAEYEVDNKIRNSCHSCKSHYYNERLYLCVSFVIWSILTLTNGTAVQAAAIYSNVDFLAYPSFEPFCALQQERFIESDGKESSLILDFNSNNITDISTKSCKRILSAPTTYGFIVRLILPKRRHRHYHHSSTQIIKDDNENINEPSDNDIRTTGRIVKSAHDGSQTDEKLGKVNGNANSNVKNNRKITAIMDLNEMTSRIEKFNSTIQLKSLPPSSTLLGRSCPLTIFSSLDPHTPQWRLDPCQLEDSAVEIEDPAHLFHGRVRIIWEHDHQQLDSKLMITVLGRNEQCRSEGKHQCLKMGDDPLLCISKDLICDGIRHCPNSIEYDSDEDYAMCRKLRRFNESPSTPTRDGNIFEHFAVEVLRNLFAYDVSAFPLPTTTATITKTTTKSSESDTSSFAKNLTRTSTSNKNKKDKNKNRDNRVPDDDEDDDDSSSEEDAATNSNVTETAKDSSVDGETSKRRNSTRPGHNSDLSKYGPWGYLMLGMLLCGGALLICGLWASATQSAANNERESNLQNGNSTAVHSSSHDHASNAAPPNYEELDPPPPYSTLFPNQKAASSMTLNSLGNIPATVTTATVLTTATTTNASIATNSGGTNNAN